MAKNIHEIRDPIHQFVRFDSHERKVLDSRPFQRLRHIHQLALTFKIYPGATHKRFEHSLGVMELASRVFDIISNPDNVTDEVRSFLPELGRPDDLRYWRRVLRMAALCHDIGHLPFSHAAEKELLPEGWDHERITRETISSDEMNQIWHQITPPIRSEDIVKLAIGPKKAKDLNFSDWEAILAEIIVGDAFGVDRMDYLLRDSHHSGVAYGKFDQYRLIDTLRILPSGSYDKKEGSAEPALGIEQGGIQSAEALMLARYFMFSQVYFHPIRRIYDIHLKDFLKEWLPQNVFSIDLNQHIEITDNEVISAYLKAAYNPSMIGHVHARRIVCREHFKVVYERNPTDVSENAEAGTAVHNALIKEFGQDFFRHDRHYPKGGSADFPVRMRDDQIVSSLAISETLNRVPITSIDYVFCDRSIFPEAEKWVGENKNSVIKMEKEEVADG
jgi:uncharacterized protein